MHLDCLANYNNNIWSMATHTWVHSIGITKESLEVIKMRNLICIIQELTRFIVIKILIDTRLV